MNNKKEIDESPPQSGLTGLLGASASVGSMTMVSRILGLARDVVLARMFGAGGAADAFFVAFKIPQFLRRLFAEGAFAQAFVPVLSEYRQKQADSGQLAAIQSLINATCAVLGGTLFLVVSVVVLAAPIVTMLFAPGFVDQPEKFELTTEMLRITFPYLLLISLTGFAGAILNSYDRFLVPAITPVLLNLSLIGFAVFISPLMHQPIYALAWAVLFAGFAQLLLQLPFLARLELLPRPTWDLHHPGVRKVMTLMLPAIFAVSVSQINLLLDTVLASFLPTGSVSWLYYSDRLAELPLGVFGIAIATVILPSLSRISLAPEPSSDSSSMAMDASPSESAERQRANDHFAQRLPAAEQFCDTLDWAMRSIVVIALPATAALVILAAPILFTLFQYSAMQAHDVEMASYSLRAYAMGLFAFMSIKVLATGFYAQQDMKTPVKIGIFAMVTNMVLNLIFVWWLHSTYQLGHMGLAMATSLAAFVNAGLLYWSLARSLGRSLEASTSRNGLLTPMFVVLLLKVVVAVLVMIAILWFITPEQAYWAAASFWQRSGQLVLLCAVGFFSYMAVLALLGVRISEFRMQAHS